MIKKSTKPTLLLIFGITLLVFIVDLIVDYIVVLTDPNYIVKLIIFFAFSLFLGTLIASGLLILVPTIRDAMFTLRRLLRTESLSSPLLLKLSSEAPGTYHHSLNVSNLAQKAAKSIGADSLLVRTAAYYHDIGKLESPSTYIENQSGEEVPQNDDLESITSSAEKIISHVEKGVEIAKKHNLPDDIINLIREHHGTTRALYFYGIAKERGLKIKETDFRYSGPTPQSKESIILMLADCCEATARAAADLTTDKIDSIVNKTIEGKIKDLQIRNSGLTDIELTKVGTSLKETLRSINHQRIQYKTYDKN